MKNKEGKLLLILLACILPLTVFSQSPPKFQESGGIIVIEIESAADYGSWMSDTTIAGHTGGGYLQYTGANFYNSPGNSLLKFEIAIEKIGKYRFQWHSRIAVGNSQSEHNDSWLRFHDASDFYGEKNGIKVYPKGVGKTPNPNGSSVNGWLKIYQNNLGNWTWITRTSDHDPHEIFVEFDSVGTYTLEVSGRSNGHAINRLALFHSEVNASQALDLTRPESERIQTTSRKEWPFKPARIWPTLAEDIIYLELPVSVNVGEVEGQIFNLLGQQMQSFAINFSAKNEVLIPVNQLGSGIYFVRFKKDNIYYQGKFMKQ